MTRILVRAGHSEASCGASGILNENYEARQVKKYVIEYLSKYAEVIDVQPPENMVYPDELNYGINKANLMDFDLGFSIHFNNAYNTYDGALGTECLVYSTNSKSYGSAVGINKKLASLGFKNRGVIERQNLGELRCINNPWLIIEVCFVEETEGARIYKALGAKAIAKAIVEGIIGQDIIEEVDRPQQPVNHDWCWIQTNYLPKNEYGTDVMSAMKAFEGIDRLYLRENENGKWFETQWLTMEQGNKYKERLGNLFYGFKYE